MLQERRKVKALAVGMIYADDEGDPAPYYVLTGQRIDDFEKRRKSEGDIMNALPDDKDKFVAETFTDLLKVAEVEGFDLDLLVGLAY